MKKLIFWVVIGFAAVGLGFCAQKLAIPGSWFLAAMIIAVIAGLIQTDHPRVNKQFLVCAQAVIGTMLGISTRPEIFSFLLVHLPLVIGIIVLTIVISIGAGMVLPKISSLNRETACMGSLPGGASAMVALSIDSKADTRIVALMQFLRLIIVILMASFVAKLLVHHSSSTALSNIVRSSPAIHTWYDYLLTPLIAVAGVFIGKLVRLPTANLLGPMILGLVVTSFHVFNPIWPVWAVSLVYIIMGLYVGLLFDRQAIVHAGRLLPLIIFNILFLIGSCALIGLFFSHLIGATPLTGYLATSPGGGDTISIIAFGCGADVSLIFAIQIFRGLAIMITGPYLSKAVLRLGGDNHKS